MLLPEQREVLEARLANWAQWMASGRDGGLGYPTESPFCRLGGQSASTDNVMPVVSIDAQQMDRAMRHLRWHDAGLWLAVHCRWCGHPDTPTHARRPLSQVETGVVLRCTERTVRNRQDAALLLLWSFAVVRK